MEESLGNLANVYYHGITIESNKCKLSVVLNKPKVLYERLHKMSLWDFYWCNVFVTEENHVFWVHRAPQATSEAITSEPIKIYTR